MSKKNWPLMLGGFVVLGIFVLSVFGPQLAPHDPMEENQIHQIDGEWYTPPFPAFTVPGYPLGSDVFGRDLLSRLLWGIQPTLVMVMIVAGVRLILGLVIGLVSGWSEGRVGQSLQVLTAGALSIPLLIVALIAIAAIGVELGIWAFIIGLSITGWAETAQVVREKTRAIKNEAYIEASWAAGASGRYILFAHVLRHVMPMVWMLFAFEISNTLMITAGLGFLGYFIGGDVWISVGDFVARRVSGQPELGQMLATSWTSLLEPWGMFAVGSVIFVTVLGFNLLGEGLRLQLNASQGGRRSLYTLFLSEVFPWLEARLLHPAGRWMRRNPVFAGLAVALVAGLFFLLARGYDSAASQQQTPLPMPEHLWAMEGHDAYGTYQSAGVGPQDPEILWSFEDESGFYGGPTVAQDGTIYLSSGDGTLYALTPGGEVSWTLALPARAIGLSALGADGTIYLNDKVGALLAVTPGGELDWRLAPEDGREPTAGPIVAPDGLVYNTFGSNAQAASPDGTQLWRSRVPYGYRLLPPHISSDGQWIFWQELILQTEDGAVVEIPGLEGGDAYVTGADGHHYFRSGNLVMRWEYTGEDAEVVNSAKWDSGAFAFSLPQHAGISANEIIWLSYTTFRGSAQIWLDQQGRVLNSVRYVHMADGRLMGMDSDLTAYVCGTRRGSAGVCVAMSMDESEVLWDLPLDDRASIVRSGAVVPGRLYVVMQEGVFYAIGDE